MSGTVTEKHIIKSVCVFVKVGLKIQGGDLDMMERVEDENESRIKGGQERAKATAVRTYEILKSLIKKYKLKNNFGKMPINYDDFPRGSVGYSNFKEKIVENNADDFTGKECIYSFPLVGDAAIVGTEILSDTEILLYFNKLPEKDIRDIIVNKIKITIIKEEVIALAVEYLKDNNLNTRYIQKPITIDEFDTYWNVYFKEKGGHGKPGKCLLRVNKTYGQVEQITIR